MRYPIQCGCTNRNNFKFPIKTQHQPLPCRLSRKKFKKIKFKNSKFEFEITSIPRVRACAFTDHEGVRTTVSLLSNWFKILRGRWPSSVQFTNKVLHSRLKHFHYVGKSLYSCRLHIQLWCSVRLPCKECCSATWGYVYFILYGRETGMEIGIQLTILCIHKK